jgi:hypothetical protein
MRISEDEMKQKITQQINAFKLDVSKTDKEGSFLCPNCSVRISPDDHSDVIYSIYNIALTENNQVDELVLYCQRCGSFIHLTGFSNNEKPVHSTKKKNSSHPELTTFKPDSSQTNDTKNAVGDSSERKQKQVPDNFGCCLGFICY